MNSATILRMGFLILVFFLLFLVIAWIVRTSKRLHLTGLKTAGFVLGGVFALIVIGCVVHRVIEIAVNWSPRFDDDAHFRDGLAPVRIHSKYGYIDKTGHIVIQPQFLDAGNFSEGVAWVSVGKLKTAGDFSVEIIDTSGNVIAIPQIKTGSYLILPKPFSEGFAAFTNEAYSGPDVAQASEKNLTGFVNRFGTIVLSPRFIAECPFSGGLTSVMYPGTDEHALIDETSSVRIPLNYGFVGCFSEGLQGVVDSSSGTPAEGYVDRNGVVAVPLTTSIGYRGEFSEGLAAALIGGRCAYANRSGAIAIAPFDCDFNYPFKDGLARVTLHNGETGYIDKLGNWTIPPQFKGAGDFSEGLALVNRGGKQEFIDKLGKTILTTAMISSRQAAHSNLQQTTTVPAIAKFPDFYVVPGPKDDLDLPVGPAKLCLKSQPSICFSAAANSKDAPGFGGSPQAKVIPVLNGSVALFTAWASSGGSATWASTSLLRYDTGKIKDLLPHVIESGLDQEALWLDQSLSEYPIFADTFECGDGSVGGPHGPTHYDVRAFIYDPAADKYKLSTSYRTTEAYQNPEEMPGARRPLEIEKAAILSRLHAPPAQEQLSSGCPNEKEDGHAD